LGIVLIVEAISGHRGLLAMKIFFFADKTRYKVYVYDDDEEEGNEVIRIGGNFARVRKNFPWESKSPVINNAHIPNAHQLITPNCG
jgi:hypothetical protein